MTYPARKPNRQKPPSRKEAARAIYQLNGIATSEVSPMMGARMALFLDTLRRHLKFRRSTAYGGAG